MAWKTFYNDDGSVLGYVLVPDTQDSTSSSTQKSTRDQIAEDHKGQVYKAGVGWVNVNDLLNQTISSSTPKSTALNPTLNLLNPDYKIPNPITQPTAYMAYINAKRIVDQYNKSQKDLEQLKLLQAQQDQIDAQYELVAAWKKYQKDHSGQVRDSYGTYYTPNTPTETDFIERQYKDLDPDSRQAIIDRIEKTNTDPTNTSDWYTLTPQQRQLKTAAYQQNLLLLGLLKSQQNIQQVQFQADMKATSKFSEAKSNFEQYYQEIATQTAKVFEDRDAAYTAWLKSNPFPKDTSTDDMMGKYSYQWFVKYNQERNLGLPIPDEVWTAMGHKNTGDDYQTRYKAYIDQQFSDAYGGQMDYVSQKIMDEYNQTIQAAAGKDQVNIEAMLTKSAQVAASRIASDWKDSHQINSPIDIVTNLAVRTNIGALGNLVKTMMTKKSSGQDISDEAGQIWNIVKNSGVSVLQTGAHLMPHVKAIGSIEDIEKSTGKKISDMSEEDWWNYIYDQVKTSYGLDAQTTSNIVLENMEDPSSNLKKAGNELYSLWMDKLYDPAVLGRWDLVLNNFLVNLGETMDITTYPIKNEVVQDHPELFKRTITTETGNDLTYTPLSNAVTQPMGAVTFSETGRTNPDYNTGNIWADIGLESISDITLLLDFGTTAAGKIIASRTAKNLSKDLIDVLDKAGINSVTRNAIVDYLSAPAFSRPFKAVLAKQIANGVPIETAIQTVLKESKLPKNLVGALSDELKDAIGDAYSLAMKNQDIAVQAISAFKDLNFVNATVNSVLMKTALISAGPGIPFMVLRKAVPWTIGIAQAQALRQFSKYQDRLKNIPLGRFGDFTQDFLKQRVAETGLLSKRDSGLLFGQLQNTVSYDIEQIQAILNKANIGSMDNVYKDLTEYLSGKLGIDTETIKDLPMNQAASDLLEQYKAAVLKNLDDLATGNIEVTKAATMRTVFDDTFSKMQNGLQGYSSVDHVISFINDVASAQVETAEQYLKSFKNYDNLSIQRMSEDIKDFALAHINMEDYTPEEFAKITDDLKQTITSKLLDTIVPKLDRHTLQPGLDSLKNTLDEIQDLPQWLKQHLPDWTVNLNAVEQFKKLDVSKTISNLLDIRLKQFSDFMQSVSPDIKMSEFNKLVTEKSEQLFQDLIPTITHNIIDPVYNVLDGISKSIETRIADFTHSLDLSRIAGTTLDVISKQYESAAKDLAEWNTLTNAEKAGIRDTALNKVTKTLKEFTEVVPDLTRKVEEFHSGLNDLLKEIPGEKTTLENLNELGQDYSKIQIAPNKEITLAFAMHVFVGNLEDFMTDLEVLKKGYTNYEVLQNSRSAMLIQIDNMLKAIDKIHAEHLSAVDLNSLTDFLNKFYTHLAEFKLEDLLVTRKMLDITDTLYRLKVENFHAYKLLNTESGWNKAVKEILQHHPEANDFSLYTLFNRLLTPLDPEVMAKMTVEDLARYQKAIDLAKQLKQDALLSQDSYALQNRITELLTAGEPVQVFKNTVNGETIANTAMSILQQWELSHLTLDEMMENIHNLTNSFCDNVSLMINQQNKMAKMSLDYFRENPEFIGWLQESRFKNDATFMLENAHNAAADTLMTDALFDYLQDDTMHSFMLNKLNLKTPPDKEHLFTLDMETSSADPDKCSIITIHIHKYDDPSISKDIVVRNPAHHPNAGLQIKTFGSQEAYYDTIKNGTVDTEQEAAKELLTFLTTHDKLENVKFLSQNGDKFDLQILQKYLPDHKSVFNIHNSYDTYTMMRQMNNYFDFAQTTRNQIENLFKAHIMQIQKDSICFPNQRFIIGANGRVASTIKSFTSAVSDLKETLTELNYYSTALNDLDKVQSGINEQLHYLSEMKKSLYPSVIAKSDLENAGLNINSALFENQWLASKAFIKPERIANFFDYSGVKELSLTSHEIALLDNISRYGTYTMENVSANKFFRTYDFDTVIKDLKMVGSEKAEVNALIQRLYDRNSAEANYAVLSQLAYYDPKLAEVMPPELAAALWNKELFIQDLGSDYFKDWSKNMTDVYEVESAYKDAMDSEDILGSMNDSLDSGNIFLQKFNSRFVASQLQTVKDLTDMTMDLYKKIPNFTKLQEHMYDYESYQYIKQLLNLATDPDKLISHILYNVQAPIIRLNFKGIPLAEELEQFLKTYKANEESFETAGIHLHQDGDELYIGLKNKVDVDLSQNYSQLIYNGKIIPRPNEMVPEGFFTDFDLATMKGLPGLEKNPEFAEQINKVYEQMHSQTRHSYFNRFSTSDKDMWYAMSSSFGAIKETITSEQLADIYKMIPEGIRKEFAEIDSFLGDHLHTGITFNHMNVGSLQAKRMLQPTLSRYYFKRLSNTMKTIIQYGEDKYQALNFLLNTDMTLHLGRDGKLSESFAKMFNIAGEPTKNDLVKIQQYLRSHPEYVLCAVIEDAKREFKLVQIHPNTWQQIREAINMNAVTVEHNTFATLYNKVNYNQIGEQGSKFIRIMQKNWQTYMILMKLGWLTRMGTWFNNALDNPLKFMADTGANPITAGMYNIYAAKEIMDYNSFTTKIFKLMKSDPNLDWDKGITKYFENTKSGMTEVQFRELHDILTSDMFANLPYSWEQRYLKESTAMTAGQKVARNLLTFGFAPISITENISRLAHYRYLEEAGIGSNTAMRRVLKTYFDYSHSKHGLIDFLFPFYNFMTNNLNFWMSILEENPTFFKNVFQYSPYIMNQTPMTPVEMVDEPQRTWQRSMLSLPLGMFTNGAWSGSYLKINFSFMEMFKLFANPMKFFENNLFTIPQQALYTTQYALTNQNVIGNSSFANIWNKAQQVYGTYNYLTNPGEQQAPDNYDPIQTQLNLWHNLQAWIPIVGSVAASISSNQTLNRRVNFGKTQDWLFPSLFTSPYHARIIDTFSNDKPTRTYIYLNNKNEEIGREVLILEPNTNEKQQSEYDPTIKASVQKYDDRTEYTLTNLGTGEVFYTQIYPKTKTTGHFVNYKNNDGSVTTLLVDENNKPMWSQTTDNYNVYTDATSTVIRRDHKTGELVGLSIYPQKELQTVEDYDPRTRTQVIYAYGPNDALIGVQTIQEASDGTIRTYYNGNGEMQSTYKTSNNLKFTEKEIYPGHYELIGTNPDGVVEVTQYYTKENVVVDGKKLTIKHYSDQGDIVHNQYIFYDKNTQERTTYTDSLTMGKTTTAKKVEKYDPDKGIITTVSYNKFGNIISTESKSTDFNYLDYTPGSYIKTVQQNYYDPQTNVILTNYVDNSGNVKYSRKIITTPTGKLYEYFDSANNLTKQVFYSSESTNYSVVQSTDVQGNKISNYYNPDKSLAYTRKIISEPNQTIYQYYNAKGKLTKETAYPTDENAGLTLAELTRIKSMNPAELTEYKIQHGIDMAKNLTYKVLGDPGDYVLIWDTDTLGKLQSEYKSLSVEPAKFTQKKAPGQLTKAPHGITPAYNSIGRQIDRINQSAIQFSIGLLNSRISGFIARKSPFSIYQNVAISGLYYDMPNFYRLLYNQDGNAKLVNNVRQILRNSHRPQTPQTLNWKPHLTTV